MQRPSRPSWQTHALAFATVLAVAVVATPAAFAEKTEDADKELREAEENARPELDGAGGVDPQREKVLAEGKQNLEDIQRMLEEIQNDLSQKKTGAGTQNQQQQVVQKMNQLIEKIAEECDRCNKPGSGQPKDGQPKDGQAGKQDPAGQKKPGEKSGEQPQGEERENQKQVASSRQQQEKEQREQQRLQEDREQDSPGEVPNTQVSDGPAPNSEVGDLVDVLRKGRKWGQLPPKVRDAIFSASAKPAPHEYRRIIDRYYRRISEQYTERLR